MDIRCAAHQIPCPVCNHERIQKAADRAIRMVEQEAAQLAAKKHDARMLARKQRQLDPAMRLVQRKA